MIYQSTKTKSKERTTIKGSYSINLRVSTAKDYACPKQTSVCQEYQFSVGVASGVTVQTTVVVV